VTDKGAREALEVRSRWNRYAQLILTLKRRGVLYWSANGETFDKWTALQTLNGTVD